MEASNEDKHESGYEDSSAGAPRPLGSWTRTRWIWLAVFLMAVGILTIVSVRMMRSGPDTSAGRDESIGQNATDRSPGSEAMLYLPGRDSVMVAVDEKALDELISAISARDNEQGLIQAGKVIAVPNNTRVRIIEAGFAKLKVRILEGDNVMFEVWVPERWVR